MTEPSLPDKVVALHHALAHGGIAHAFGGALALAYYAEPRTTVGLSHFDLARATLTRQRHDGQVRCRWGRTPIDLFFSYDSLHDAMRGAIQTVPFGPDTIPILGPEHLVVCKAVFNRPKDWLDIDQVLATVDGFDAADATKELERLVGSDDPRATRLHEAVERTLR